MTRRRARLLLVMATLALGCGRDGPTGAAPDAGTVQAPEPPPSLEPAPHAVHGDTPARTSLGAPRPDMELRIGEGTLRVGSAPGTPHRNPAHEADLSPLPVPAFRIDRLPYPNDPSKPPRTGVTRQEAARLCEAEGKRLCHELEWERACRGDTDGPYPFEGAGTHACDADLSCESPLGMLGLGRGLAEWTASDAEQRLARGTSTAVIRGGEGAAETRCAFRRAADPTTHGPKTGFRCCRGPAPDLTYPAPKLIAAFEEVDLPRDEIRRRLAATPELAPYAADFQPTTASGIARALRTSNVPERAPNGWALLRTSALRWSPTPGDEVWVVAGVGAGSGLIAALYPGPDDTWVHAASYVLEGEPTPVAIMHTPDIRSTLRFTACYTCAGEDGTVELREDGTLVVR